jgi:hypothetical protein
MKETTPWGKGKPSVAVSQRDAETGHLPVRVAPGLRRVAGSPTPFQDMLREWQAEQELPPNA